MKFILLLLFSGSVFAYDYESSPNNYKNSASNYENSPNNWKNSPNNYDNSPNNYGNPRTIYGVDGDSIGYSVPKTGGGMNLFDNDGDRYGYTP